MYTRTVSPEDLARLKAEREEADRLYNEALSSLDAARLRGPIDLPHPPPGPDEHQVTPLNESWSLTDARPAEGGWRGKIGGLVWNLLAPLVRRQDAFNSKLVDHINRNIAVQREMRNASASTLAFVRDQLTRLEQVELLTVAMMQRLTPFVDTKDHEIAALSRRVHEDLGILVDIVEHRTVGMEGTVGALSHEMLTQWEGMLARERRIDARVASLAAAQDDLRGTIAVFQQASLTLKRELERVTAQQQAASGRDGGLTTAVDVPAAASAIAPPPTTTSPLAPAPTSASSIDSYKYVGFEDRYRGSQDEIRARLSEYLPYFAGASDVLDVGCGRGELIELLQSHGITARGLDVNHEMVEVCRARGLNVAEGDAVSYLRSLPDESLGGLIAAQVVEHLEPDYLLHLLDVAYHKLRPNAPIILETINPACWFAFFSSYIRDITHVRPLHPDTLSYLLTASGFQRVTVRYSAPFPDAEKLQPVPGDGMVEDVFNANVDKLNGLMFTYLDYAAIGVRL